MLKWSYFYNMESLSVITICFNNLEELKLTCASVDSQTMKPYEHIIVDGSNNNLINDWLKNTPQPSFRKWVTEKDKGISDAFNKGIARATGQILHILNSADIYYSDTVIKKVLHIFQDHPDTQWASGNIYIKRGGIWVNIGVPFDAKQLYKGMRAVSHPTWFLKKAVYDRVGHFSLNHSIAMDYDLMCRLPSEKYHYINETIVKFDDSGVSTHSYLKSLGQNIKVYESHFGFSISARLWQFRLRFLYYLLQTKLGKFLYYLKATYFK